MTNVENMTTEELRERALLIQQMRADIEAISKLDVLPEEHDMRAVAAYRGDLEAIAEIDVPDGDDVKDVAQRRRHEVCRGASCQPGSCRGSGATSRAIRALLIRTIGGAFTHYPLVWPNAEEGYRNEHYRRFPWRVFNARRARERPLAVRRLRCCLRLRLAA